MGESRRPRRRIPVWPLQRPRVFPRYFLNPTRRVNFHVSERLSPNITLGHLDRLKRYAVARPLDSESRLSTVMARQPDPPAAMETAPLPTPASFAFPYPQPYDIQNDLMKTVFRAIEERKIAIVSMHM